MTSLTRHAYHRQDLVQVGWHAAQCRQLASPKQPANWAGQTFQMTSAEYHPKGTSFNLMLRRIVSTVPTRRVSKLAISPVRHCSASSAADDAKNMVLCNVDSDGFATVTLNRPEVFNAFSDVVISRCSEIFEALRKENGKIYLSASLVVNSAVVCSVFHHLETVTVPLSGLA